MTKGCVHLVDRLSPHEPMSDTGLALGGRLRVPLRARKLAGG